MAETSELANMERTNPARQPANWMTLDVAELAADAAAIRALGNVRRIKNASVPSGFDGLRRGIVAIEVGGSFGKLLHLFLLTSFAVRFCFWVHSSRFLS